MRINKILWIIVIVEFLTIIISLIFINIQYPNLFQKQPSVIVIDIFGEVISSDYQTNDNNVIYAQSLVNLLKKYEKDNSIKAIILDIDINGGDILGGSMLAAQIRLMKKPVVTVVRDNALSGGYYIAASTKRIFANELSNIADIGVSRMIEYPTSQGYKSCYISTSDIKVMYYNNCDSIDSFEYEIDKSDLSIQTEMMATEIASFRNLSKNYVMKYSDGTIFNGNEALNLNLIDQIGGVQEANDWLEQQLGEKLEIVYSGQIKKI